MIQKDDEIVRQVLENRELRRKVIEAIKEDVEDALNATLVNAIRQANERPSKWWEWLFLIVAGLLGGVGLGLALAIKAGLAGAPVPPPP